jgi:tape measure domain-containing protein
MAADLRLALRITGDASNLKAEIVGAKQDLAGLGSAGQRAGEDASGGLSAMAASATRAAAALAGVVSITGALRATARAGDEMNASLGRLAQAVGSAAAASDVYERLYQLSLRTGVATNEAAGAFSRFAIAAKEVGATQSEILSIVQLLQQAGALAGASTQETASATLQLGQALASGKLQGDELRSILEAMPNLAQALARELGVGLGELRKMGEEGKLTAEVVIPALNRAAGDMARQFAELPPSLSRSVDILGSAMTRFLADLDKAVGLSRNLASVLGATGQGLESARGRLFPTPAARAEADVVAARGALDAARAMPVTEDEFGLGAPSAAAAARRQQAIDAALTALEQAELRRGAIEREADQRIFDDAREAADRRRANERRQAEAALAELRETLDRRLRIRREAAEREAVIDRALAAGAITPGQAAADRAASNRIRDEELAKLAGPPVSGREGLAATLEALRQQQQEGAEITRSLRTPLEVLNDELARYDALLGAGTISQETHNRAVERAREAYRRAPPVDEAGRTLLELERLGERAFDRVGQSITQALTQGQLDFRSLGRVGLAVASELTQAFAQLAIINPIKNSLLGGSAPTLGSVFKLFGFGAGEAAAAGTSGAVVAHTGGILAADRLPVVQAPARLFATAPRLHGGGMIGPDEVPAILRRGEGVFTPAQMAAMAPVGAGGGDRVFAPTIHFHGDAGSEADRAKLLAEMRAAWLRDIAGATPVIIGAAKRSLVGDVHRVGLDRALGSSTS